ncbi:MAG: MbnP family protein [Saprospiraceae bacterium]
MKCVQLLCAILLIFSAAGCTPSENEVQNLKLSIKGLFGGEPFITAKSYPYDGGKLVNILRSDFFISEISLIHQDGSVTVVSDIDLAEISETHTSADNNLNEYILDLEDAPEGSYTGIQFGVGVPPALNAKKDTDFPSSHALSQSSFYWSAWQSFIFSRTEGNLNPGLGQNGFTYHAGTDGLYRVVRVNNNFELTKNNEVIPLNFDIKQLFKTDGGYIDIENNSSAHGLEDLTIATIVMNNYTSAFSWR